MTGRFEQMGAALSAVSDAEDTLWEIYEALIAAEVAHIAGWEDRDKMRFIHLSRELLFEFDDYRKWGETPHFGIRDYETDNEGVRVRLKTDLYRGEDFSIETIIFPPDLVDAWETPEFEAAMARFVGARVARIQEAFEEAKRTHEERLAIQKREQEERDRAEFARLSAKFGKETTDGEA